MDTSVLLENTPLVKFIRNFIRDSSGVFSISSLVKIWQEQYTHSQEHKIDIFSPPCSIPQDIYYFIISVPYLFFLSLIFCWKIFLSNYFLFWGSGQLESFPTLATAHFPLKTIASNFLLCSVFSFFSFPTFTIVKLEVEREECFTVFIRMKISTAAENVLLPALSYNTFLPVMGEKTVNFPSL